MSEPFKMRIAVRSYELDTQGHVNGSVYIQWADHVRTELARHAGVVMPEMIASGVAPINLETTVRFKRELRGGDEVDITCEFVWGEGKTFQVQQALYRPDGTLVAEVVSVSGVMDLRERRLVPPRDAWRRAAAHPERIGL
jgi:acyl-CoA thioester hydrolase